MCCSLLYVVCLLLAIASCALCAVVVCCFLRGVRCVFFAVSLRGAVCRLVLVVRRVSMVDRWSLRVVCCVLLELIYAGCV